MVGLVDLPEHVLTHSLSYLDVKSLLAAGATCRALHAVTNDEEVWRRSYLNKYDDPRRAAAFCVPRTDIEWKKNLTDREAAIGFLQSCRLKGPELDAEERAMLTAWAPRVCGTVLDLFLDLPPAGQPSVNKRLLISFIQDGVLSIICHAFETEAANHLEALLNRFPNFWSDDFDRHVRAAYGTKSTLAFDYNPIFKLRFHSSEERNAYLCAKRKLWAYPSAATMLLPPPPETSQTDETTLSASFDALRGQALSVLASDAADALQPWDWACVGGSWEGKMEKWVQVTRRYARAWSGVIPTMSLEVVESREAVESAYPASDRADLWAHFGDVPGPVHGLAPIYFHGTCSVDYVAALDDEEDPLDYGRPEPRPAFVHGVVYLDTEMSGAPQVKYVLVATGSDPTIQWRRMLFEGVEPWGPRSGAGVFGSYWRPEDDYQKFPTGYIWFQKL